MKKDKILRLMNKELDSVLFNDVYVTLILDRIVGSDVKMYIRVKVYDEFNVNTLETDTLKLMDNVSRKLYSGVEVTDRVVYIDDSDFDCTAELVYVVWFKLIDGDWREKLIEAHEEEQALIEFKKKKEAEKAELRRLKKLESEQKLYEKLKKKFENN